MIQPRNCSGMTSLLWVVLLVGTGQSAMADWSEDQIPRLPNSEVPIHLFNGSDLSGWEGHIGKYFTVENGMIIGKNTDENAPRSSTYLLSKNKYRNFRLIFESRLVTSEMHSGISLWGKIIEKDEGPFTYQGHLVMYPSGYGYYDLFRRNSVFLDTLGVAKRAGVQHDWNRMEILAIGNRIRHVINGQLVADWSDPQPELCESGPVGLQLHSNKVAQEVQWRGLILTENPQETLVTASSRDTGLITEGKPAESGMSEESLKKIDGRMQEFIIGHHLAGAVTLVARRGRVVHLSAIGKADVAENRDLAKDSLFAIASMTKPITATAVMILVDEGKLQLDDPVSKYIPSFHNSRLAEGKLPVRQITIRDCLNHTCGLVGDDHSELPLKDAVDEFAKADLAFDPGSQWKYGRGLSVAGRVVEVVSGTDFEQFLTRQIFEPLEMTETSFHPTADHLKRLAHLYQPTAAGSDIEPADHWLFHVSAATVPNPSGGLFSTAADLVRFYQMILNGGDLNGKRILSADAVRQMTSLQTGSLVTGNAGGWGLGFSLVGKPVEGRQEALSDASFGHGGAFGTQGWIDPEHEIICVLLVARRNFPADKSPDLRNEFHQLAIQAIQK